MGRLGADLAAERAARQAADAALQNTINNLQTSFSNAINDERAARQAADAALQANITATVNAETAARQAANEALQNQITILQNTPQPSTYVDYKPEGTTPNGDRTEVLRSQVLPPGNYHVLFTGVMHIRSTPRDTSASVTLYLDDRPLGEFPTAVISFNGTVTFSQLVSIPQGSSGRISVFGDNGGNSNSKVVNMWLIAIPVARPVVQYHPGT